MKSRTVLITGGAGYIGSHACLELLQADFNVVVVDNLSNSKLESLTRVQQITGKTLTFYQADIRDKAALSDIFAKEKPSTVIHFADGTRGRTRTGMTFQSADFESAVSTISPLWHDLGTILHE